MLISYPFLLLFGAKLKQHTAYLIMDLSLPFVYFAQMPKPTIHFPHRGLSNIPWAIPQYVS